MMKICFWIQRRSNYIDYLQNLSFRPTGEIVLVSLAMVLPCFVSRNSSQWQKKQTYKPDSVTNKLVPYHLSSPNITIGINLSTLRQRARNPCPDCSGVDILEISPHRVYLVSLQHYLYLLSVALVLEESERYSESTDGRYPLCFSVVSGLSSLPINRNGDKAVCGTKVGIFEFIL